jgi:hypothetical protein
MTKIIVLDSNLHYSIKENRGALSLVEYGEECPHEGHIHGKGMIVETWEYGEEVDFLLTVGKFRVTEPQDIECGDDFIWSLRSYEERWPLS